MPKLYNDYSVCEECHYYLVYGESDIEDETEIENRKNFVKSLPKNFIVKSSDSPDYFSNNNCDCCGGLPGMRTDITVYA